MLQSSSFSVVIADRQGCLRLSTRFSSVYFSSTRCSMVLYRFSRLMTMCRTTATLSSEK